MSRLLAVGFLLSLASAPLAANEAGPVADISCPAPLKAVPRYPPDAARAGKGGVVMVRMRVDGCGRVIEAEVQKSSGRPDLNEAALVAKRASVLTQQESADAVSGWVVQEVSFHMDNNPNLKSRNVDWPKTHRRPIYIVDDSLAGQGNVAKVSEGIKESVPDTVRPRVLNVPHRFMQVEGSEGREFWLMISDEHGIGIVAVRYRPVMEGGMPVVRMAMVCDLKPEQCVLINRGLMKGLPFARAK